MAKTKTKPAEESMRSRPALDPEARENQLIALSVDLVEKRLREGTASSQEVTHFLRLGSTKARLENEKTRLENELTKAKTESLKAQQHTEELFADAIKAMQRYSGNINNNISEDDWDENIY